MEQEHSFVITGANSFLGKAFAEMLTKNENYKVFLTSRGDFTFSGLDGLKNIFCLQGIDLTSENDMDKLKEAINQFIPGRFHIINCVGYFPGYELTENLSIGEAKKIFDSNVLSLYGTANKLIPLMCKHGGGHFIAFSTHTAYQNYPRMVAFTAAKAAVESLITGLANEYLEKGINANTIALATLLTETELKMKPNGDSKNWLSTEEVCKLVEEIITKSSRLINGNVIHAYKFSDSYFNQSYFERIDPNS